MTKHQLLSSLPSSEIAEWMAYYNIRNKEIEDERRLRGK